MTQFNIEIVSDTVCPWCYVGKKKLEQAVAEYKRRHLGSKDTFELTWKAFYLRPDAPLNGVDKMDAYRSKFGADRTAAMLDRLSKVGKDIGIEFNFEGRTGNTRNSHRLIHLAREKSPETQTAVVDNLMRGYFEDGRDITNLEFLTSAGAKAGLDEKEVKSYLKSRAGQQDVDVEAMEAKEAQISGVPNFTVNGRYEVGGAQEPEVFLRLFELIKAAEK